MVAEISAELIDTIARAITAHSYTNHVNGFNNVHRNGTPITGSRSLGDPVPMSSPADMEEHIRRILNDPNTRFAMNPSTGRTVFYHPDTNTTMVFNPAQGDGLGGTVFRTADSEDYYRGEIADMRRDGVRPVQGNVVQRAATFDELFSRHNTAIATALGAHEANAAAQTLARAQEILENPATIGFWADDHGRVTHYIDNASNTVVTISPSGASVQSFETLQEAQEFFGTKMEEALRARGQFPDLITGGHNALAEAFQATRNFWPRVGATVADVATNIGRVAKVIGPLGVIGATAEAAELGMTAHTLQQYGLLPENFVYAYDALLAAHVAQATADPSMVLGEGAIQLAFDELCDQFDIPHHIREEIEPSSLLEMIFGDGNPSPDANAAYNDPFYEIYNALPTEITDDMPPEVQALVEFKAIIEAEEHNLTYLHGGDRYEAEQRLEAAQNMYTELYDSMNGDGHIDFVTDYLAEQEQPPVAVAEEPDAAPAADEAERVAEYGGQSQSLPSPM